MPPPGGCQAQVGEAGGHSHLSHPPVRMVDRAGRGEPACSVELPGGVITTLASWAIRPTCLSVDRTADRGGGAGGPAGPRLHLEPALARGAHAIGAAAAACLLFAALHTRGTVETLL